MSKGIVDGIIFGTVVGIKVIVDGTGIVEGFEDIMSLNEEMVFILDGKKKVGYYIDQPYMLGNVCYTPIGEYAFYASETDYGMYIDGLEVQTGSIDSMNDSDVIVTIYSDDFTTKMGQYVY